LSALIDLESIPSPKLLPTDEISVDTFYNFGWDKLHEIDIPKLVLSGVKKWGEKFQIGTIDAASYMANNYRDLVIKRAQIESKVLNHHDARQANIAWHPEKGTAIVDWSWADIGLPYGDTTMFLLDLHKSGHKIDSYMQYFNPTYAKMILGYWLHRSQTKHTEGNQAVRMQQFLSAIKASEIILNN
jgi:thiamine kinase-like enzyme